VYESFIFAAKVFGMSILTKNIKNIIFDFGGVLINLDYERAYNAFRSLGIPNLEEILSKSQQIGIFDEFEKGNISPDNFRKELRKISKINTNDFDFDWAWNQLLLDIPQRRLEKVIELKKNFRVFLLSNTNKIHYDHYLADLQKVNGFNSFENIFEKAYFSHEINMKKPDREIFEFVLKDANLIPEETLFIDDTEIHVKGARQVGINAYHLKHNEDITGIF
jgi:glucose-1-phosphatase